MPRARVGIVALLQESNTFLAGRATLEHFTADLLVTGEAVRMVLAPAHHEVGGFFAGLAAAGLAAVPIFAARALPYGTMTAACLEGLLTRLHEAVDACGPLDRPAAGASGLRSRPQLRVHLRSGGGGGGPGRWPRGPRAAGGGRPGPGVGRRSAVAAAGRRLAGGRHDAGPVRRIAAAAWRGHGLRPGTDGRARPRPRPDADGLEPAAFRLLVAKGVHAPVAAYREVCREFLRVDTPGVTTADLGRLAYRCRRRPLHPFE